MVRPAESRIWLALDAIVERLEDVFFEAHCTRMGAHHGLALRIAVFADADALRRAFVHRVGVTPAEYRKHHGRLVCPDTTWLSPEGTVSTTPAIDRPLS